VSELLGAGAHPLARDDGGKTARELALAKGHSAAAAVLKQAEQDHHKKRKKRHVADDGASNASLAASTSGAAAAPKRRKKRHVADDGASGASLASSAAAPPAAVSAAAAGSLPPPPLPVKNRGEYTTEEVQGLTLDQLKVQVCASPVPENRKLNWFGEGPSGDRSRGGGRGDTDEEKRQWYIEWLTNPAKEDTRWQYRNREKKYAK
jgi:hypothetical protein